MRTEKEMLDVIINTAIEDERIRAVIMNGSRVNPNVKRDCFQDYDIMYVVNDIQSFTSNHNWVHRFGEIMIVQMPEEMSLVQPDEDGKFPYLMQFMDGNRIDLTLVPVELIKKFVGQDSLSKLLLDKDNCLEEFPPASDKDYLVKKPTEKEFLDCCNEFWWCSTNIAKGLWREELSYAKGMLEGPVRDMFIVMLEWYIGMKTDFTVNTGKFESISSNILKKICGSNLKGHFLMQNMKIYGSHSLLWVIYLEKWRTKLLTHMNIKIRKMMIK